jgi:hypothetical protein
MGERLIQVNYECAVCGSGVDDKDLDIFDGLCYPCYHMQFEHKGQPDKPCDDPSCFVQPKFKV